MSKLRDIFVYIALAGAVVAAYFGYSLIQKYTTSQSTLGQAQSSITSANKKAADAVKDEQAANAAKDQATADLTQAKSQLDDDNTKLASAQKAQDDLNAQLTQAKTDVQTAKDNLDKVNATLGMSPEDAKAAILKGQSDLAAAQSQEKILQDQLQALEKQVTDLQDAINRSKVGNMPPGISGKVTFVNRAWNFVVLNVGISNGVVPNGELIVYRGRNFLGKIKITSAEATTAVADILPNAKADIQIGDDVLN